MSGNSEPFSDYEFVCCVCAAEEEIATIRLDVSRVVLPPADDGRGAEKHRVACLICTIFLYAVGMFYVLGADSSNRGLEFPTLWSQYVHHSINSIKTETITPRSGLSSGHDFAYDAARTLIICFNVVLIIVWSRRFVKKNMFGQIQDAEHDVETWRRRFENKETCTFAGFRGRAEAMCKYGG